MTNQNLVSYQTIQSNQIFLNSALANTYSNGSFKSFVKFNLNDVVSLDKNALELRISLVNAQFPYSFYQINSTNNKINIYYLGTTISYYFPYGNYNVNSFINQWYTTIGSSYTITYSTITNKFIFTNPYVFHFSDDVNSLFSVMGFQKGQYYISTGSLAAPYCFNFNGLTRLNIISSNFSVKNIDCYNEGQSSVIASCPINCFPGGIILYNNVTNFKSMTTPSSLNTISLEIVDDNENYIDFNNQDWTLTFQLDIVKEVVFDTSTVQDIYQMETEELNY
jgi:hypothetical protein